MNLLNNAKNDFNAGEILFAEAKNNNELFNIVCFHLQQCMEKSIKYLIEKSDEQYDKNEHDIFKLADRCLKAYHYNTKINEKHRDSVRSIISKILLKANIYTYWESESRYGDLSEMYINISEAFDICKILINLCKIVE